MAGKSLSLSELTVLVEGIVAQVVSKSFGEPMATWAASHSQPSLYLSHENGNRGWGNKGQIIDDAYRLGKIANYSKSQGIQKFGEHVMSFAGVANAYQTGDALSGAMSGASFGPWGAAAGLLAGLFSPGIDHWQRPKFKNAQQVFDKLFTMDRGGRDEYYLPDSFYFRSRRNIPRNLVVRINDKRFDEHINESLTNNYAAQLQRGLVF